MRQFAESRKMRCEQDHRPHLRLRHLAVVRSAGSWRQAASLALLTFGISIRVDGPSDGSFPPNHVTYNVGRKTRVRMVATSSPPMMAKAIGPQNTVGAIGIMPRTVDTAVSMIGRKRELAASTAAAQTSFPCARSPSI